MAVTIAQLTALSDRLKGAQQQLIEHAASSDTLPPDSIVQKITAYEGAIAAIEVAIEERSGKR
jgi:hypothetical protein